jgi:tRNA G10  N-methylase Trm11
MRVVPNKEQSLNAAQVLNNKMTDQLGMELVLVRNINKTILAQTTSVQDIDAYAARDQERPARDARVGMLPPKLAQIIINLASPAKNSSLLDPFCGTGVLLQEALLMGLNAYGTDLEERMIDYSRKNLDWLSQQYPQKLEELTYLLETGDACTFEWQSFDTIACETYLGRPFSTEPNPDKLREVIQDVDTIHRKFLSNVARQTKTGFRMCIAMPAWHTKNGVKHLPMLDHLTDMGYTRISFVHSKNKDLVYHRENQIVGRELVALIRK